MQDDRMIMILQFSENVLASFDVEVVDEQKLFTYVFTRIEDGRPSRKHGQLLIHNRTQMAEMNYDVFTLRARVVEQKKLIDNYYFKCEGDVFSFKAYICHRNLWLKCGAGMFKLDEKTILDSLEGHCRQ